MPIGILWHTCVYDFKWHLPCVIKDSRNKVIWSSHQNDNIQSVCIVVTTIVCLSQEQKSHLSPYTMLALSSLTVTPRCSSFHLPIYHSLTKKGPWAEHLTSLPKRDVLSTVSAFNHERAPTLCLQWLEAFKANNLIYKGITGAFEVESWRHTTLRMAQCQTVSVV